MLTCLVPTAKDGDGRFVRFDRVQRVVLCPPEERFVELFAWWAECLSERVPVVACCVDVTA